MFSLRPTKPLFAVALFVIATCQIAFGQSEKASDLRIYPHVVKDSPTGYFIPKDLDGAITELDHILSRALQARMKKGSEDEMGLYHLGLGMTLRNDWGLWQGLTLAKWFNGKGIFHPDDMSGIILKSYWRHLRGRPIDLASQVKYYQDYWKQARENDKEDKQRAVQASAWIRKRMMSMSVSAHKPAIVQLPAINDLKFRARYASPMDGGVLLTAKVFDKNSIRRKPDFLIRSYFLDFHSNHVRPVVIREGDTVEDSVVVGRATYFNCVKGGKGRILRLCEGHRTFIPWPSFDRQRLPIRLGIEADGRGLAANILAIGEHEIARLHGSQWENIAIGKVDLPTCILPPQKVGPRIYFRDEGENEEDKGLYWINTDQPSGLYRFDDQVGIVGSYGPRWENVWDYRAKPSGELWISTGSDSTDQTLIRWTPQHDYQIAIFNDRAEGTSDLVPRIDEHPSFDHHSLAITGLEPLPGGGLLAIGPFGLLRIQDNRIEHVIRFEHSPQDWIPSGLLSLGATQKLALGHFGGLLLLTSQGKGKTTALFLDERMGKPIQF